MGTLPTNYKAVAAIGYYSAAWAQDYDSPSRKAVRAVLYQNIRYAHMLGKFDTFITSMAPGFATDFAFAVLEFRKEYPVLLVACLTSPSQGRGYTGRDWNIFNELCSVDSIAVLTISSDESTENKVRLRDEAMVDMAEKVISWPSSRSGNVRYALNYAKSKGKGEYNIKERCF